MISRLEVLLKEIERLDASLAADLRQEATKLSSRREFGLNFERRKPETVQLYGRKVRRGDKVQILSERGASPSSAGETKYRVLSAKGAGPQRIVDLVQVDEVENQIQGIPVEDLVVIADFRDPIYPGLRSTGKVERGVDKPYHAVINAENFHALEALLYTHEGKVDAIYIDPPYNTGAKDWKYNNNYVDGKDAYRHSKWLSFMERRLEMAKRLLNPKDSMLIVTIDEKEYLRLGLLLEQTFPNAIIQMVSSVINQSGVARDREFYRADEYLFFVFIGESRVIAHNENMLVPNEEHVGKKIDIWRRLLRSGTNARRVDGVRQFYPFWIDPQRKSIHSVGDFLPLGESPSSVTPPKKGLVPCWPIRSDHTEGCWQLSADTARALIEKDFIKLGAYSASKQRWSISYLRTAERKRIESGEIVEAGRDGNGALIFEYVDASSRTRNPVTVWNKKSHNAGAGGSNILRALLPGRKFPFPKSLYAVEDALRFFCCFES